VKQKSGGLWRQTDFLRLWLGQTISEFGSTVTREALPLTALLLLNASPFQLGALAAIGSAPVLLVGLFAGAWLDRVRRRPVMIAADLSRAVLLLAIPIAAILGQLRLEHLFVVAPAVGILTVFFAVAHQSYVPTLVSRPYLMEANSKLGVSSSLAEVTAPGTAGVLVQILSAPLTLLIDAASFVASGILILTIRQSEATPTPSPGPTSPWREIGEGIRFVLDNRILRAFAARSVTASFFGNFFAALYAIYCIRTLGLTPALLGLTVAAGGAGGLIGAVIAERLVGRLGIGRTIVAALIVGDAIGWLIPLAGGPIYLATALMILAQLAGDGISSIFEIASLSVRQTITPDHFLGRVNSAMYVLGSGIGPFGALVGGALGSAIGIREAVVVAVLGGGLGGLWVIFSPVRTLSAIGGSRPAPID
jgi:predicted MFS family arabinose efflux permease